MIRAEKVSGTTHQGRTELRTILALIGDGHGQRAEDEPEHEDRNAEPEHSFAQEDHRSLRSQRVRRKYPEIRKKYPGKKDWLTAVKSVGASFSGTSDRRTIRRWRHR